MRVLIFVFTAFVLVAATTFAQAQNPGDVSGDAAATVPDVQQCAADSTKCAQHNPAYDKWCQDNQTECTNQQVQIQERARCQLNPQQCTRTKLEQRLNRILQGACAKGVSKDEQCDKVRARLQELQVKDEQDLQSAGG